MVEKRFAGAVTGFTPLVINSDIVLKARIFPDRDGYLFAGPAIGFAFWVMTGESPHDEAVVGDRYFSIVVVGVELVGEVLFCE